MPKKFKSLKRSTRETGLLYRIRDAVAAARAADGLLQGFEDMGALAGAPAETVEYVRSIRRSIARVLAIEEGKQESDFEAFGIVLNNLGIGLQRRNKS